MERSDVAERFSVSAATAKLETRAKLASVGGTNPVRDARLLQHHRRVGGLSDRVWSRLVHRSDLASVDSYTDPSRPFTDTLAHSFLARHGRTP